MSNYLTGLSQLNPQVKRHNGGGTSLTLDSAGTTNATMLYVNGVAQTPGVDFNVSGATLTTTSTLPSGTNICTTIQYFSTGVVNTVADNAIGLGQMASGVDGNVISYDASGNPVAVATGNDGQVLTSTGAGSPPAFEDAGGGAWSYISSVTASNSATVAFTGLDATYDRYWITFASIVPQTDNTQIYVNLGTGGGPTYNTGSNYVWQLAAYMESASSWSFAIADGDTKLKVTGTFSLGTATGEHLHGDLYLVDPANTSNYTSVFARSWWPQQSSARLTYDQSLSMLEVQTAVTAMKFYMDSGNIASGTFRLYGLNKS